MQSIFFLSQFLWSAILKLLLGVVKEVTCSLIYIINLISFLNQDIYDIIKDIGDIFVVSFCSIFLFIMHTNYCLKFSVSLLHKLCTHDLQSEVFS